MAQVFKILVGALAVRQDSILLLQRSERERFMPGAWGLPCGKVDFGEELPHAVLRELREESGLVGVIDRQCGTSFFMSTKGANELHNVQVNFVLNVNSERVVLDDSSQAFEWLPLADYASRGLDSFTTTTIAQYFVDQP